MAYDINDRILETARKRFEELAARRHAGSLFEKALAERIAGHGRSGFESE